MSNQESAVARLYELQERDECAFDEFFDAIMDVIGSATSPIDRSKRVHDFLGAKSGFDYAVKRAGSETLTIRYQKEGEWFTGWVDEVHGVNCQERTLPELLDSIVEVLNDFWELPGNKFYKYKTDEEFKNNIYND